jgi:hypothetical protein
MPTIEDSVRQQLALEVGEDEIPQTKKFALLQKFGLYKAILDRHITMPFWITEPEEIKRWKKDKQKWEMTIRKTKQQFQQQKPRFQNSSTAQRSR